MPVRRSLPPSSLFAGFTLIEMLVVLAVIALLAMTAYPGYRQLIQRSQRAQARAALLDAAQYMARFHTVNQRYDLRLGLSPDDPAARVSLPPSLRSVPAQGRAHHRLVLAEADEVAFKLEARAESSDTGCGVLTLDQAGRFGVVGSGSLGECWN